MRIYLIGYMASGKSNLGRLLAEKLDYGFLDLDYQFEERFRISILDFFEKYDEGVFRKIEHSLLNETIDLDDVVISTGGGTPCFYDNMDIIKRSGISIYLCREVPALVSRLKMAKLKRPILKNIPLAGLEEKVAAQLNQRAFFYNQADFIIQSEEIDLENIHQLIRNRINSA